MSEETKYALSDNVSIAYQVVGDGPIDLVLVPGFVSNIEVFWEEPNYVRFIRHLAKFSRVILFDKRGTGLSDRVLRMPILEVRMDDVRAVMDAVGSDRAALVGYSEGGPLCALFAATYPERVSNLIMIGCFASLSKRPDYPFGFDEAQQKAAYDWIENDWGSVEDLSSKAPSVANDERFRRWRSRCLRMSASPSAAMEIQRSAMEIDIRQLLPTIRVPTLIVHSKFDAFVEFGHGSYLADNIPDAKLAPLDCRDHLPWLDGAEATVESVQTFLTGHRPKADIDRVLATIMFTDIVESTKRAVSLGDRQWGDLRDAHHSAVRAELAAFHGMEVDTNGDGFVASFDGPARAVRCAAAVRDAVAKLGLTVRVGLHTGECEIADGAISGVALNIAARVSALAPGAEIIVSRTIKDLVAGSGIAFEDFGVHTLKGVPEDWQLYRVSNS